MGFTIIPQTPHPNPRLSETSKHDTDHRTGSGACTRNPKVGAATKQRSKKEKGLGFRDISHIHALTTKPNEVGISVELLMPISFCAPPKLWSDSDGP